MTGFLIKKIEKKKKIIDFKYDKKGYDFKPRINSLYYEINKITIFNDEMINDILSKKINKQFKRVAAITYDILSDDEDSTSDAVIALDEIAKLKSIILNKYHEYLKKEEEKRIIKKIKVLENELKTKIIYEEKKVMIAEEIKGRGR